jgi:ribosomal protein S18 acetylase RimI-like enzyme
MISVERLITASESDLVALNALLQQLRSDPASHTPITREVLNDALASTNTIVLVAKDDGVIVGTGTIVWNNVLTDRSAFVEDVVVDSAYRGQGLGKRLMSELITIARANGVQTVALTSRPSRIEANTLYPKLGFKRKETNYYELDL